MNFQFQIKKEDYKKSLVGFFKYLFFPAFIISFLFAFMISLIIADPNYENSEFNWIAFFITFSICMLVFLYWFLGRRYISSLKELKKSVEKNRDSILNIDVSENEIRFKKIDSDEEIQKKWGEFKKIYQTKDFTYFLFTDGNVFVSK